VDQHDGHDLCRTAVVVHNVPDVRDGSSNTFAGEGLRLAVVSRRGAAFGDLFNDGKIDVIVTPSTGRPRCCET